MEEWSPRQLSPRLEIARALLDRGGWLVYGSGDKLVFMSKRKKMLERRITLPFGMSTK